MSQLQPRPQLRMSQLLRRSLLQSTSLLQQASQTSTRLCIPITLADEQLRCSRSRESSLTNRHISAGNVRRELSSKAQGRQPMLYTGKLRYFGQGLVRLCCVCVLYGFAITYTRSHVRHPNTRRRHLRGARCARAKQRQRSCVILSPPMGPALHNREPALAVVTVVKRHTSLWHLHLHALQWTWSCCRLLSSQPTGCNAKHCARNGRLL